MDGLRLRALLKLDAATCAAMAAALLAAAEPLAAATALPAELLRGAGLVLVPTAALMAVAAARPMPALVRGIVAGNGLWIGASLLLLLAGWGTPNLLGLALVGVQAAAVAALALAEHRALGRGLPEGGSVA